MLKLVAWVQDIMMNIGCPRIGDPEPQQLCELRLLILVDQHHLQVGSNYWVDSPMLNPIG